MDDNRNNPAGFIFLYVIVALGVFAIVLLLKISGVLAWSWPVVALSFIWAPLLAFSLTMLAAVALIGLGRANRRIREWKRRRNFTRVLREAMEGLTLNSVGPIYGIKRMPKEKNRSYKRRILKAARTLDKVNTCPPQINSQDLDNAARKLGIERQTGETDDDLKARIGREAVEKRRQQHGV